MEGQSGGEGIELIARGAHLFHAILYICAQVHFFLAGALARVHEDGGADAEDPGCSYEAVRSDFEAAVNVRACGCGVMCWGETGVRVVCVGWGGKAGGMYMHTHSRTIAYAFGWVAGWACHGDVG